MLHPTRNQHYVPQFLLRNFTSNAGSHVWAFDKNAFINGHHTVKERAIKSSASDEYFYDKEIESVESSFEHKYKMLEDIAAPIVSKIISTGDLGQLSEAERTTLASFVATQFARTKGSLNGIANVSEQLYRPIEEAFDIELPRNDNKLLWKDFMMDAQGFEKIFLKKTWVLFKSDAKFLISDNPVALSNIVNPPGIRGTLGLNSLGIEIYLPLSASFTLGMLCEKTYFNRGTYKLEHHANLDYYNSLQVLSAVRFLFSTSNAFALVTSMMNEQAGRG